MILVGRRDTLPGFLRNLCPYTVHQHKECEWQGRALGMDDEKQVTLVFQDRIPIVLLRPYENLLEVLLHDLVLSMLSQDRYRCDASL